MTSLRPSADARPGSTASRFWAVLTASPEPTPLSRYTVANGLLYITMGLALYAFPGLLGVTGAASPTDGETGLLRIIAFVMAVIGWFYVMGGRTRADSFGLATVVDRLIVPAFLLPLAIWGDVDPHLVVPFAILDPVLGLGALAVWLRQERHRP